MVALYIGTILKKMRIPVHKNGWGIRLHYCTFILNCLLTNPPREVVVNHKASSGGCGESDDAILQTWTEEFQRGRTGVTSIRRKGATIQLLFF